MTGKLPWLALAGLAAGIIVTGACGGSEPAGPRVFYVEPQNGTTVKSPVKLRFGIESYELAAVPTGDITMARKGMGHHHVGVDTDCLPAGSVIPKANPWVHHGGGQTEMDMQLTPGTHKLTLQLGDDTHTTIEGLCSSVTITVVE
jgi:hypothetical protein